MSSSSTTTSKFNIAPPPGSSTNPRRPHESVFHLKLDKLQISGDGGSNVGTANNTPQQFEFEGFGSGVPEQVKTDRPGKKATPLEFSSTSVNNTSSGSVLPSSALTQQQSVPQLVPVQPQLPLTSRTSFTAKRISSSRMSNCSDGPSTTRQHTPQMEPNQPITPAVALKLYDSCLTDYEQSEVFDFSQIYYLGAGAPKVKGSIANSRNNHGYDDDRGDYQIVKHDHIGYRFEVLGVLGKGSFGQVVKGLDWKTNQRVAIKLIRNKKRFHHQALVEVKLLEHLREMDRDEHYHVVKMYEYFYFRNHLCITFELLSINLYEFIKNNNFQGLSLALIRRFAIQILTAISYLYREKVVHCDLKPENILLRSSTRTAIKVIDFGSSCFEDERIYTYIQSRFYRSPEVILGMPYGRPIDMWSFGCILAELYTGYPLFPGEDEVDQMACIMEVLGVPSAHIVEQSTRKKHFFDQHGNPRIVTNAKGKRRRPNAKDLATAIRCQDAQFISFLEGCLRWDPAERMLPDEAMKHPWIIAGMVPPHARSPTVIYQQIAQQQNNSLQKYGDHNQTHERQSSRHSKKRNSLTASGLNAISTTANHTTSLSALNKNSTDSTAATSKHLLPPIVGWQSSLVNTSSRRLVVGSVTAR